MKRIFASAIAAWMLLAAPNLVAGTLQRCAGADGVERIIGAATAKHGCLQREAQAQASPGRRKRKSADEPATPQAPPPPQARPPGASSGRFQASKEDGVLHYVRRSTGGFAGSLSGLPQVSAVDTCFACDRRTRGFVSQRLNPVAYAADIRKAARTHGIDEAVVRAVIHAESAFNPNALSHVGAQGLMQLMPATARRFGVRNAFDATQNIDGGVRYLAWLLKRFRGDLRLAAAGYNAGEGAVDRYKGVPPYRETRQYVQRVSHLASRYRALSGQK